MSYFQIYEEIRAFKSKVPIGSVWESGYSNYYLKISGHKIATYNDAPPELRFTYHYSDSNGNSEGINYEASVATLLGSSWKIVS